MKLKFPKKIIIGDTEFWMKYNKTHSGGSFQYPFKNKKGQIEIGTEHLKTNPIRVLGVIIHELKEIIQVEQSARYIRQDEGTSYEFHYSHKEHTDLCARLSGLLTNFIV